MAQKLHLDTIAQFHKMAGLSQPFNALLSVVRFEDLAWDPINEKTTLVRDFYVVALKKDTNTKFRYGQQDMDIAGGSLHFMAPKQVLTIDKPAEDITNSGWLLLIHPDFLWHTPLAKKIRQYEYFSYNFNQVLPLNMEEETTVIAIFRQIQQGHYQLLGNNTSDVILAQIELLLAYAERYYRARQFRLAEKQGHSILAKLEVVIDDYFRGPELVLNGIPTIKYLSNRLHILPNYLSRLFQSLTGQSTQHYLHDKLIAFAKEKLSTTSDSISEIAYQLGFKTPQSFSRLFKGKTNQTPTAFRSEF